MLFSCALTDLRNSLKSTPAIDYVSKVLGTTWPLLTRRWDATKFDLLRALTTARQLAYEPIFSMSVEATFGDPSVNSIFLSPPSTFISKDVLLSDSGEASMESYFQLMVEALRMILRDTASSVRTSDLHNSLLEILDLEVAFINVSGCCLDSIL